MSTTDYTIGGARLFFNDGGADGAAGNGFLDLGNIPTFTIDRNTTEIEHFAFIASALARQKDLTLITDIGMSFNFTLDELFSENWNILLWGNGTSAADQAGDTIVSEASAAPVLLDRSIFTAESNYSSVVIKDDGAVETFTVGDDYELTNPVTGEIKILSTGDIVAGEVLELSYTSAARSRTKIIPGKDTAIQGSARLEFQGQNGGSLTWVIHNCEVKPDGASPLSSSELSESNVILNILADKVVTPAEPFGYVHHG
jgi:hypothetical protein